MSVLTLLWCLGVSKIVWELGPTAKFSIPTPRLPTYLTLQLVEVHIHENFHKSNLTFKTAEFRNYDF